MPASSDAAMRDMRTHSHRHRRCRRWLGIATIAAASFGLFAATLRADEPTGPTTRPALQQLNDETTATYQQIESGLVHVEIPRPTPMFRPSDLPFPQQQIQPPPTTSPGRDHPAGDASEQQGDANPTPHINIIAPPGASITVTAQSSNGGQVTVVHSQMENLPPQPPNFAAGLPVLAPGCKPPRHRPTTSAFSSISRATCWFPMFIDRPAGAAAPLRVVRPDGSMQSARFVGSDRQTDLSVLQIDKPVGTPLQWTGDRPAKGSIVLYLSSTDGSGRLGMWTGGAGEFGVVVSIDGHIDGIARFGQFLSASDCRLIARQLVQFGAVRRAALGIFISEIQPDDPLRTQLPALGARAPCAWKTSSPAAPPTKPASKSATWSSNSPASPSMTSPPSPPPSLPAAAKPPSKSSAATKP